MMVGAGDIENDYKLNIRSTVSILGYLNKCCSYGNQMHMSCGCQKEMQRSRVETIRPG